MKKIMIQTIQTRMNKMTKTKMMNMVKNQIVSKKVYQTIIILKMSKKIIYIKPQ